MALNWVTLGIDQKTFVPLDNEEHFLCQNGVSFDFNSGNGYPGSSEFYGSQKGIIYITNIRVVYIAYPPTTQVKSISIPLENLKDEEFIQPWFGANYFQAALTPVPDGGLRNPGIVKFTFKEGGGFSFVALLKQVNQRRLELGDSPSHLEELPRYEPPPESISTTNDSARNDDATPSDMPPSYEQVT